MRPRLVAASVVVLLCVSLAILAGGRTLIGKQASEIAAVNTDEMAPAVPPQPETPPAVAPDKPQPSPGPTGLERVAPRDPLGDLGLASPPKPKPGGTVLYRPIAQAAGKIDAMGYSILLAGIEPLEPDETCSFEGREWPCGARARSAFRAFLRGRAVTCDVPAEPEKGSITAACRLGKQDVSEWLVKNGWARAAAGGPYAKAGEAVRAAGKGVFGPPPAAGALPPAPEAVPMPTDPSVPFQ